LDWKRLIEVLSEIKTVYAELLELADEKRSAVFEKNIERIDAVVRREQAAAVRLSHWEKQRLLCMDSPEGPSEQTTLLFLSARAPKDEGEKLRFLHDELSEMLQSLTKKNTENKTLVESRLEYVQFVLDALSAEQSAGIYGGRYGAPPPSGGITTKTIFDQKG
jgi:flagellar biosynthesis/type III secretory pathway chaperone